MRIRPSKLFSTIFLIAVLSSITFSQSGEPQLWGRFSGGDILEFNYLISQKYFGSNFGSDSRLVLRICSDKGLLDAIALGAGMFTTASEKEYGLRFTFDRYGLSKTKILYAVYSGCESGKSTFKTVEYWVVPNGAKLEVDDEITAKEIRITANTPHSNKEFLAAIRDAGSSPNTAAKFFVGAYNKRPSDQLRQNMKKAQDFLKDESEPWKFEFVQIEADIGDPEPEFPATIVVYEISANNGIFDPFDDYGELPWNEELGRLDNFAINLTRNPEMVGYILYYVGENDNAAVVRQRMDESIDHLVETRKIERSRLILKYLGISEESRVILQPVPRTSKLRF